MFVPMLFLYQPFLFFMMRFPRLFGFEMLAPIPVRITMIVPVLCIPDDPDLIVTVTAQASG